MIGGPAQRVDAQVAGVAEMRRVTIRERVPKSGEIPWSTTWAGAPSRPRPVVVPAAKVGVPVAGMIVAPYAPARSARMSCHQRQCGGDDPPAATSSILANVDADPCAPCRQRERRSSASSSG